MDKDAALLAALRAASVGADDIALPAERVRALGAALGLSDAALIEHVEALNRRGLLRLRWGGDVAVTRQGRDLLDGRGQPHGGIRVGPVGRDVIIQQDSPGATAGRGAIGAGAIINSEVARNEALGALALALAELRGRMQVLEGEARERAEQVAKTAQELLQGLQNEEAEAATLSEQLQKFEAGVETLANMAIAAQKLGSVLAGLVQAGRRLAEWWAGTGG